MNTRMTFFVVSLLAVILTVAIGQETPDVELLANGSFDGEFVELEGAQPRNVATGWTPWHVPRSDASPSFANHDPNYDSESDRIRGDDGAAQKYFTLFATHQGGLFQQVGGVTSGTTYRFSVYGYVWSSSFEDADVSEDPGDVVLRVGIDPTGGTDGESPDIIWSTAAAFYYDAFRQYAVIATAESDTISVFIESTVGGPRANNYVYVDDAALEVASETVFAIDSTPTAETLDSPTPTPTLLPTATADGESAAAPEPTATTASVTHIVQEGDTVSALALQYDSSIVAIAEANSLDASNSIVIGQALTVPISQFSAQFAAAQAPSDTPTPTMTPTPPPTATPTPPPTATPAPTATPTYTPTPFTYQVRRGDTLGAIAQRFGSYVDDIVALNGLINPHNIDVGQILVIATRTPIPTATAWPTSTPTSVAIATSLPSVDDPDAVTYTVQSGDTLSGIAALFGTTVDTLVALNGLENRSRIYVGQVLLVEGSPPATPTPTAIPTATPHIHVVRAGDTLFAIALQYGVWMNDIAQLNGLANLHELDVGQVLVIPG